MNIAKSWALTVLLKARSSYYLFFNMFSIIFKVIRLSARHIIEVAITTFNIALITFSENLFISLTDIIDVLMNLPMKSVKRPCVYRF